MNTRAAVAWKTGKFFEIETTGIDAPKDGDSLLRNVAFDLMHEGKSYRSVVHH